MIKNKQFFIIFIIIISNFSLLGQNKYERGYILTNQYDTLWGFVKDRKPEPFGKIYSKIRFKSKKNSIFHKKYTPSQIIEYKRGENLYKSIWIKVTSSFLKEQYTSVPNSGEKIFLKVIVSGYITYYQWEYEDGETGNIDAINLYKRQDEYTLIKVTQGIFGLNKKQLANYFQDCPELAYKITSKQIKDPLEIVVFYNKWKISHP